MEYEARQAVYIPTLDHLELEFHFLDTRPGVKPETFLTELLKRWLVTEAERLALQENGPPLHGFQWKTLFLPDETTLRTCHDDTVEFAKVSGDHIISEDGQKLTPSRFANRQAKGRNAWRFVWLRFPGDDCWIRADDCRARLSETPRKQSTKNAKRSIPGCDGEPGRSNSIHGFRRQGDFDPNRRPVR